MNSEQRVLAREESILRMLQDLDSHKQTRSGLLEKRRAEMHNLNTGKFGEQTIGIHGQNLPKFHRADTESKQWWKFHQNQKPV